MAINTATTDTGFLSPDINVQSNFGLGEQSALLTTEDVKPSQPYQVTTVQETIPAAPPVAVRNSYDPFASDLEGIISPFTDPEQIRERRKKEEEKRKQIRPVGEADPLFESEPSLNVGSPEVPQLKVETPEPTLQIMPAPSQDLTARVQTYGEREVPQESIKDPFAVDFSDAFKQSTNNPEGIYRTSKLAVNVFSGLDAGFQSFSNELAQGSLDASTLKNLASSQGSGYAQVKDPSLLFKGVDAMGLVDEFKTGTDVFNKFYDPARAAIQDTWQGFTEAGSALKSNFLSDANLVASDLGIAKGVSKVKDFYNSPTGQNVMKGAGAALSAYGAYNAFKAGDTLGGVANTVSTIAYFVPGLQPVALALTAASFISSLTGWGRGKPKPGMGGSELKYDPESKQLAHSDTWSYNGFDPSQAKTHTDKAVQFINGYTKQYGMKIDPTKFPSGQSNWQYLSRIDVSPYRNGSQSSGELIERWMSSGAIVGKPSYFDTESGERRFFTSQEQYEQSVSSFANKIFA